MCVCVSRREMVPVQVRKVRMRGRARQSQAVIGLVWTGSLCRAEAGSTRAQRGFLRSGWRESSGWTPLISQKTPERATETESQTNYYKYVLSCVHNSYIQHLIYISVQYIKGFIQFNCK